MFFGSARVYCTHAGRNSVVGRRTLSGAATAFTKQPSSQQAAHNSDVNSRVPLTTSRLSFLGVREPFKLPSQSSQPIFSRREAAVEHTAAIFGSAWEWDSAALAPQTLWGWRFFLKTYNNLMNLLVIIDWQHWGTRGFDIVSDFTRRRWIQEKCFTIGNCFETHDSESTETWPVKREGWVSANWLS